MSTSEPGLALHQTQGVDIAPETPTRAAPIAVRRTGGLAAWQLRTARELMSDLTRKPSLERLASAARLSTFHFCRAFRQSTGVPPHKYMVQCRIERTKELMRDPDLSLTEIALRVGFADSSKFSSTFRRVTGMTPREFRKEL